jgi:conjugal transfer pilus assembly protein TraA
MKNLIFLYKKHFVLLALVTMLFFSHDVLAGTGGEEFADVWDTLKEWIQGTLGRVVCGSMILVGIVAGVARQSISAFAIGIGGGIGLYNTPTVIESVLSSSLSSLTPAELALLGL